MDSLFFAPSRRTSSRTGSRGADGGQSSFLRLVLAPRYKNPESHDDFRDFCHMKTSSWEWVVRERL